MPWLFDVDRSDATEERRDGQECATHDDGDERIEDPDATAAENAAPATELSGRGP
jgi:hypothetical protein